jgi:DNA-binding HxlR family transcriptional regulator
METMSDTRSPDGRFDVLSAACPTRQVVGRIGDKWTLLVLTALAGRTLRFSQLRREVEGITQKMLTQTLRGLERDGLVDRRVYPVIPPHVEYSMTTRGATLAEVISGIRDWAYGNMDGIETSRLAFDQRAQLHALN